LSVGGDGGLEKTTLGKETLSMAMRDKRW